jgi:hypothetical protein
MIFQISWLRPDSCGFGKVGEMGGRGDVSVVGEISEMFVLVGRGGISEMVSVVDAGRMFV